MALIISMVIPRGFLPLLAPSTVINARCICAASFKSSTASATFWSLRRASRRASMRFDIPSVDPCSSSSSVGVSSSPACAAGSLAGSSVSSARSFHTPVSTCDCAGLRSMSHFGQTRHQTISDAICCIIQNSQGISCVLFMNCQPCSIGINFLTQSLECWVVHPNPSSLSQSHAAYS